MDILVVPILSYPKTSELTFWGHEVFFVFFNLTFI